MDKKWFKVFHIYMLFILRLITITASEVKLLTDDGNNKCVRKLQSCSLFLDGQLLGQPGAKGNKGFPGNVGLEGFKGDKGTEGLNGTTGPKGTKGDQGAKGEPGPKGSQGIKGEIGEKGEKGDQGKSGSPGQMGDSGVQGLRGLPGMKGFPGEPGRKGLRGSDGKSGVIGPPGINASPGTSDCSKSQEDSDLQGTMDDPAHLTCKFFSDTMASGTYHLGPFLQVMKVYCNMTTRETCLKNIPSSNKIYYTGMKQNINEITNVTYYSKQGAFWLSDMTDMLSIYKLKTEQITWLQQRSSSVSQTIRYYGKNSSPYSSKDISTAVHLLTWNDVVIGPYPTNLTSFYYSVPIENYNVKGNENELHSDIVLRSTNVYRLPIRDILIRDVKDELQMFYIEILEICFT